MLCFKNCVVCVRTVCCVAGVIDKKGGSAEHLYTSIVCFRCR